MEDNYDDEVKDNRDNKDYDPVGDASADLSSLDEEEEGQDHGRTATPTGLVERDTFHDIASTFRLFITPTVENIILDLCTKMISASSPGVCKNINNTPAWKGVKSE
ncbi:unnamed protein product [Pleuronectes platessa]|uniref:Uncharacterized protein n=1 Tax=Pleuronectes platessa TaxID=8262 RepID=A0A9N7VY08_PLEPL|nr:unnamed protein product [Pleuronectes platessa]